MRSAALFVVLATVLASCGGTAAPAATAGPAFLSATLTDVRSGETFQIGAFPGKVVLVIAMAVW